MLTEAPIETALPTELLAGGSDPLRFDWREAWYPVHYVDDLAKTKPNKFTLLAQDLVIWWDRQANCWRVFADQCPHRLVPLSEGRIAEDGLLECPYHGWAFQGNGQCDRIPQQIADGNAHQSPRACATSYAAVEQQGLLFVYPGQADAARVKVPVIEPLVTEPEGWICLNTFRDLPYDALTLLENVLDSSHLPFTHHRSVGNRANAAPVELDVVKSDKQGFQGFWAEGPRRGTLGSQHTTFVAPALMWHDLTSQQFGRTLTAVYATPMRKGECRVFARFPFKFSTKLPAFLIQLTPRWYSHLGNNGVLEDDQIFLHQQERNLAAQGAKFAQACYLPTRADTFVTALRQWVQNFAADPFAGKSLPPLQARPSLLDRYHSHTIHCRSCRSALTNLKRLRIGLAGLSVMAWTVLPLAAAMGIGTLGLALLSLIPPTTIAAWVGLGRLERQFYEGREIPMRNLPEQRRAA